VIACASTGSSQQLVFNLRQQHAGHGGENDPLSALRSVNRHERQHPRRTTSKLLPVQAAFPGWLGRPILEMGASRSTPVAPPSATRGTVTYGAASPAATNIATLLRGVNGTATRQQPHPARNAGLTLDCCAPAARPTPSSSWAACRSCSAMAGHARRDPAARGRVGPHV